jgi:hypothetical protein
MYKPNYVWVSSKFRFQNGIFLDEIMFLAYILTQWKTEREKKIHIRKLLGFCQRTKVLAYLCNEKPKGKQYSYLKIN